jgi:hypothetical protein
MESILNNLEDLLTERVVILILLILVFIIVLVWSNIERIKTKKAKEILAKISFDTEQFCEYIKNLFYKIVEAEKTKKFSEIKANLTTELWKDISEKNKILFNDNPEQWIYWPLHYNYENFEIKKIDILGISIDSSTAKMVVLIEYNGLTKANISDNDKKKIWYLYAVWELILNQNTWQLSSVNYYYRTPGFFKLLGIKNYYNPNRNKI